MIHSSKGKERRQMKKANFISKILIHCNRNTGQPVTFCVLKKYFEKYNPSNPLDKYRIKKTKE